VITDKVSIKKAFSKKWGCFFIGLPVTLEMNAKNWLIERLIVGDCEVIGDPILNEA
jgi:hypothetical protein